MPPIGTPKGIPDLLSSPFQHRTGDMHVPGPHPGRSPRLPPHDRVDHDVWDAEDQEDGRGGVASVMETAVSYAGVPEKPLPYMEVGVGTQRSADRRGEDVPLALPVGTGRDSLALLGFLVLAENLDQRIGQADCAPARAGLGGLVLAAGLLPLGAVARLPAAGFAAAAVRVLRPEPVLADADVPRVQVDVFPVQSERLTLAEPERQGDDPARTVAELGRLDEEALYLLDRVRLDVLLFKAARLRRPARAGGHGPPPLPVSATTAPAPGHSARSTAKPDSQAREQPAQPEHQDHDQVQAEPEQARSRRPHGRRVEIGRRG